MSAALDDTLIEVLWETLTEPENPAKLCPNFWNIGTIF